MPDVLGKTIPDVGAEVTLESHGFAVEVLEFEMHVPDKEQREQGGL